MRWQVKLVIFGVLGALAREFQGQSLVCQLIHPDAIGNRGGTLHGAALFWASFGGGKPTMLLVLTVTPKGQRLNATLTQPVELALLPRRSPEARTIVLAGDRRYSKAMSKPDEMGLYSCARVRQRER